MEAQETGTQALQRLSVGVQNIILEADNAAETLRIEVSNLKELLALSLSIRSIQRGELADSHARYEAAAALHRRESEELLAKLKEEKGWSALYDHQRAEQAAVACKLQGKLDRMKARMKEKKTKQKAERGS